MGCSVVLDWKFVVAVGASTVGIIFAIKMDSTDVKEVLMHGLDALEKYPLAI